jgi:hypothetical protein
LGLRWKMTFCNAASAPKRQDVCLFLWPNLHSRHMRKEGLGGRIVDTWLRLTVVLAWWRIEWNRNWRFSGCEVIKPTRWSVIFEYGEFFWS